MMNGCQKCDTGFGFEAYVKTNAGLIGTPADYRILWDSCVKLPDYNPNCYAYMPMSDSTHYATNILSNLGKCV